MSVITDRKDILKSIRKPNITLECVKNIHCPYERDCNGTLTMKGIIEDDKLTLITDYNDISNFLHSNSTEEVILVSDLVESLRLFKEKYKKRNMYITGMTTRNLDIVHCVFFDSSTREVNILYTDRDNWYSSTGKSNLLKKEDSANIIKYINDFEILSINYISEG